MEKIPFEILSQIFVDTHLIEFYNDMENHILSDKTIVNTYSKDKIFVGTMNTTELMALVKIAQRPDKTSGDWTQWEKDGRRVDYLKFLLV